MTFVGRKFLVGEVATCQSYIFANAFVVDARRCQHDARFGQHDLDMCRVSPNVCGRETGKVDVGFHVGIDGYGYLTFAQRQVYIVVVTEYASLHLYLVVVSDDLVYAILGGVQT